jgi:hypothetical protein
MNVIKVNLKQNGNLTYNNNPKMIVLHHTEAKNCTIQDINSWHLSNGWTMCGYHYFVNKKGEIYQGRTENAQGSHCPTVNRISIGISAEGDFMTEKMNDVQKLAIVNLCKDICKRYGITDIKGHKDVPYSTDCPGVNYPLNEIKKLVNQVVSSTPQDNMSKPKVNYCLEWQKWYNAQTKTTTPLICDGIYGSSTKKSMDDLLTYIKQGKKYKYCLEFQKFYNKITQTSKPIIEDGYWGKDSENAFNIIAVLIK